VPLSVLSGITPPAKAGRSRGGFRFSGSCNFAKKLTTRRFAWATSSTYHLVSHQRTAAKPASSRGERRAVYASPMIWRWIMLTLKTRDRANLPKPLDVRQRNREHDARRRTEQPWRKWYSTSRWQAVRLAQLRKQPLCERCLSRDMVVEATVGRRRRALL
jgi:hypothetical protein